MATALDPVAPQLSDASHNHDSAPAASREIRFEYSRDFPRLLQHLGVSLLVSTYQAGKLIVLGCREGALHLSFHNFEKAMGVAARTGRIAVGARNQIWSLTGAADIAPRLAPAGAHDACYLTRTSHFTGDIHAHELAWAQDELWVVNTLFSCLCTLDERYSFVPRWRPPFISTLAPEDRCHLNGVALAPDERGALAPRYATALAETDTAQGWRPNKATSGCLIDVRSGESVARGFAMPHSPRVYRGRVWLLDSGKGRLAAVEPASGTVTPVAELPGYTRGLALHDSFAFVGLSRIRETSTFGGLPIAERREELRCGVGVIDLRTGRLGAHLEFQTGVEEIFAVEVLPGTRCPVVSGPYPEVDGVPTIWSAPDPAANRTNNP